ncbi:MAG: tetratricopeptide repeat protein, partial [Candidatus Aureabacteria bacterium]|nr:tetratricopeptide repeat protein [Candidatus Auribacterota bacterium]
PARAASPEANTGKTFPGITESGSRKNIPSFATTVLIIGLGIAVYANSLNGKFVADDAYLVRDNIHIKNWSRLPDVFTKSIAAGGGEKWNSYRPFQMVTYMLDYRLWGLNEIGYHITNVLLHILVALSVYSLVYLLFGDTLISLLTAILFITHPVHAEAVSFISGRADALSAFFVILSIISYVRCANLKATGHCILCPILYILALLSRENSIILPAILVVYHYVFRKKISVKPFAPILGVTVAYMLLRAAILRSLLFNIRYPTTLFQRVPGCFVAMINYARILLLPFDLHMQYGNKIFSPFDPKAIGGFIAVSVLLIYALRARRRPLVSFSILWFLSCLLPQANLYPINAYMAEHWLYLPSMGFFIILAGAISWLYRDKGLRGLAAAITAGLLAFYSYVTIKQNGYWQDAITYYERTLRYSPDHPTNYCNLGNAYSAAGNHARAVALYKRAIEINPGYAEPYNNLAIEYKDMGKKEEATALLGKAMDLNPRYAAAYSNLGIIHSGTGHRGEAIAAFKKAIELDPDYAEAYNNLGIELMGVGESDTAVGLFKKAIEIDPCDAGVYINLGLALKDMSHIEDALSSFKRAIEINPNSAEAYYCLGRLYATIGSRDAAISSLRKAIEIKPGYAPPYNCLAVEYFGSGNMEEAGALFKKAIELDPTLPEPYNNLGLVCRDSGRKEEAIGLFQKAMEIDPTRAAAYNNLGSIYAGTEREKEAISLFKKAIELNPGNAEAHFNLAKAYYHKKNYSMAISHCDKAAGLGHKIDPQFLKLLESHRR